MNFQVKPQANSGKDLRFDKRDNWNPDRLRISEDGQRAETLKPELHPYWSLTEARAYVAPFDWGGYGTLRVKAILAGDREVVGYLENTNESPHIPLPKRTGDSTIADKWKIDHEVLHLSDDDDSENTPVGDGYKGDGLTLYEEYRGFFENGGQIWGDPKKKDFFICNTIGKSVESGIDLFTRLSGLTVHYKLLNETEFPDTRRVNFNYSEKHKALRLHNPNPRCDQHGILMVQEEVPKDPKRISVPAARAVGGPGAPGAIEKLAIYKGGGVLETARGRVARLHYGRQPGVAHRGDGTPPPTMSSALSYAVAHELFHCCNVFHHGQPNREVMWTISPDGKSILEDGVPITVLNEADKRPISPNNLLDPTGSKVYLADEGGSNSGHEKCVMRYFAADAYVAKESTPDRKVRYLRIRLDDEKPGDELCAGSEGTGVNGRGWQPQSRCGDATLGNCRSQICVNDAARADPQYHEARAKRFAKMNDNARKQAAR